jgi:hypothetical protein
MFRGLGVREVGIKVIRVRDLKIKIGKGFYRLRVRLYGCWGYYVKSLRLHYCYKAVTTLLVTTVTRTIGAKFFCFKGVCARVQRKTDTLDSMSPPDE